VLRAAQFHELVEQLVDWGRQGAVSSVPEMRTQLVAARTVAEALADLATNSELEHGAAIPEIAGPREESMVETARLLVARRGDDLRIQAVSDPSDPDHALYLEGGLLPSPHATLAGPDLRAVARRRERAAVSVVDGGAAPSRSGWAVVTGASSGLGREFALALSERGHPVLAVPRRGERLRALVDEVGARGGQLEPLVADLSTSTGIEALLARADELEVDLLVNNAGIASYSPFASASAERERGLVRLNVEAIVALTRGLLPQLLDRGRGGVNPGDETHRERSRSQDQTLNDGAACRWYGGGGWFACVFTSHGEPRR
jgi:uncharacterized protein YbjT (DUF2867 family)